MCIVGGLVGYLISNISLYYTNKSFMNYNFSLFVGSMWFIPYISTYGLIKSSLEIGGRVVKSFDQGWSEYLGRQNLYNNLVEYSKIYILLHNNRFKIYLLTFVLWIVVLFGLIITVYSNSL